MHYSKLFITIAIVGGASGLVGGAVANQYIFQESRSWSQVFPIMQEQQKGATQGTDRTLASDDAVGVVERTAASVVSIQIRKKESQQLLRSFSRRAPLDDFFSFPFPNDFFFSGSNDRNAERPKDPSPSEEIVVGGGTGFIVDANGTILTNKHVVSDESARYIVITSDGKEYDARVVARDPVNDLAVVKIEAQGLLPLEFGDSSAIRIGQTVIAIGNSLSQYRNTVTKGVVSGIGRRVVAGSATGENEVIEEAIQTDAAINPGNSGGPLLTMDGKVIGINTAINREGQSIGFAIPSNIARSVVESVERTGRIVRAWLGVRYLLIDKAFSQRNQLSVDHGALIVRGDTREELAVIPGSPADKAGIIENDIILDVNGATVTVERPLGSIISRLKPGDTITLTLLRKGSRKTITAQLEEYSQKQ